jgi:hypothetical protein
MQPRDEADDDGASKAASTLGPVLRVVARAPRDDEKVDALSPTSEGWLPYYAAKERDAAAREAERAHKNEVARTLTDRFWIVSLSALALGAICYFLMR